MPAASLVRARPGSANIPRHLAGHDHVSNGPDLSHFVQHRQLDVYAQSMARQGYAYGVDLRRSRWLSSSTVGNALVRAVDRAWPRLAAELGQQVLESTATPVALLREVAGHMSLLRAPLPTVRPLRDQARGRWPLVTALGATRGGSSWLLLDVEALSALEPGPRAFLLGAGLGHLHCEHAVFFSAHLLAVRKEGSASIRALRATLRPWTKVMTFSADRAGLLACGQLDAALSTIESPPVAIGEDPSPAWLPPAPPAAVRMRALEEFAKSAVFARVRAARARRRELARRRLTLELDAAPKLESESESDTKGEGAGPPPPPHEPIHVPADAWPLARVDARLTERLNLL